LTDKNFGVIINLGRNNVKIALYVVSI
jgi:hypothetical protein